MSIFHLDDLPAQERLIAEIIVFVVVHLYPPGTYKFVISDLYTHRGRIQERSEAQNIEALIRGTVYTLKNKRKLLKNDEEVHGGFELTKGGLLFYLVREKRLQEEIERATQALENAKQELNEVNSE